MPAYNINDKVCFLQNLDSGYTDNLNVLLCGSITDVRYIEGEAYYLIGLSNYAKSSLEVNPNILYELLRNEKHLMKCFPDNIIWN